ncbi:hypothetical protein HID58_039911 [Brassica napus]|uniref:Uncharacterized protein n=1 Tax=Brassica napus TaxID=3708 RepID=A0ABQ7XFE3_BRANA|nr:hypothetical protein HID58_092950 [Brassica napus]KAH0853710.1 hypothetical protein HID58_092957 [Brassica napus]KAH0854787.1 hypothetical protein HID58_039911 [Brassica napus]
MVVFVFVCSEPGSFSFNWRKKIAPPRSCWWLFSSSSPECHRASR